MIEFMKLCFEKDALEPVISKNTVEFHYGKHHKAYVDKVNELIKDSEFENMDLEEIIKESFDKKDLIGLYNNAGQVYNHNMYWNSMGIGEKLGVEFRKEIIDTFGSLESFREKFVDEGVKVFGSGWVWLVRNKEGKLEIMSTRNGDTPLVFNKKAVFNIDVWEHAYYLDYQNLRKKYLEEVLTKLLKL